MDDALIARLSGRLGISVQSTRLRLQRLFGGDAKQSLTTEARLILELIKSMDDAAPPKDTSRRNRKKIPIDFQGLADNLGISLQSLQLRMRRHLEPGTEHTFLDRAETDLLGGALQNEVQHLWSKGAGGD
jgi:hypothetical protein